MPARRRSPGSTRRPSARAPPAEGGPAPRRGHRKLRGRTMRGGLFVLPPAGSGGAGEGSGGGGGAAPLLSRREGPGRASGYRGGAAKPAPGPAVKRRALAPAAARPAASLEWGDAPRAPPPPGRAASWCPCSAGARVRACESGFVAPGAVLSALESAASPAEGPRVPALPRCCPPRARALLVGPHRPGEF